MDGRRQLVGLSCSPVSNGRLTRPDTPFRHFNVWPIDVLRVPLKTIQERIGHALTESFTLDVYGHTLDWTANEDAKI